MGDRCSGMKLSPLALGLALGIMSGLIIMLFTLGEVYELHLVNIDQWASIYPGIAPTWLGCLMGLAWGFLDGLVFGAILAEVYNLCLCGVHCCCCKSSAPPEKNPPSL